MVGVPNLMISHLTMIKKKTSKYQWSIQLSTSEQQEYCNSSADDTYNLNSASHTTVSNKAPSQTPCSSNHLMFFMYSMFSVKTACVFVFTASCCFFFNNKSIKMCQMAFHWFCKELGCRSKPFESTLGIITGKILDPQSKKKKKKRKEKREINHSYSKTGGALWSLWLLCQQP